MTNHAGLPTLAVGPGVDDAILDAVLLDIGLGGMPLVRAGQPLKDAAVLLLGGITAERLDGALSTSYSAIVEFTSAGAGRGLAERLRTGEPAGTFRLSMSTATAFGIETAKLVCDSLDRRGALPESLRFSVEMALHEILANAILHGNLGIKSSLKADPERYECFWAQVQERLANRSLSDLWVDIAATWGSKHLQIAVADQGEGYEVGPTPASADHDGSYGRGLGIVLSIATEVTVCDGGRRTILRFDHET
jgi:anti-sigma regulatory factor (Ser/Thr protein kinase)